MKRWLPRSGPGRGRSSTPIAAVQRLQLTHPSTALGRRNPWRSKRNRSASLIGPIAIPAGYGSGEAGVGVEAVVTNASSCTARVIAT